MSKAVPLAVRDDLEAVTPYVAPQLEAPFRMNTNESPYAPPVAVLEEISSELASMALNRYPDRDAAALYDALSTHTGWPRDALWIANGSNEVLLHIFLAFGGPGRTALTFEPTYSLHTLIPRIAGTGVVHVERDDAFRIDLDAGVAAIQAQGCHIVVVCSPNNPTGNGEPLDSIRALLEETAGLVVVDEAYGEFARADRSAVQLLPDHANLVVVKTFSKAWRLAGVRIGYMMAHPSAVAGMARVRLPYALSTLTQAAGVAALRHASAMVEAVDAVRKERDEITAALGALGLKAYPSQANFVLFEVDDADGVWSGLLERGVLVRNYSSVARLSRCLRVTAGTADETEAFLSSIEEVLAEGEDG